jgi:hypothetical protein
MSTININSLEEVETFLQVTGDRTRGITCQTDSKVVAGQEVDQKQIMQKIV